MTTDTEKMPVLISDGTIRPRCSTVTVLIGDLIGADPVRREVSGTVDAEHRLSSKDGWCPASTMDGSTGVSMLAAAAEQQGVHSTFGELGQQPFCRPLPHGLPSHSDCPHCRQGPEIATGEIPSARYIESLEAAAAGDGPVVLVQVGNAHELYGPDAVEIARQFCMAVSFARCEGRTIARLTVPMVLVDAVVSHLSNRGRTVIMLSEVGSAVSGAEPPRSVTRTIKRRVSAADREAEVNGLIEALPARLRAICRELLALPDEDQRTAQRMFRSWFTQMRRWRKAHDAVNFFGRPGIPDADELDGVLELFATFSGGERNTIWKAVRRFRENLDEARAEEASAEAPLQLVACPAQLDELDRAELAPDTTRRKREPTPA